MDRTLGHDTWGPCTPGEAEALAIGLAEAEREAQVMTVVCCGCHRTLGTKLGGTGVTSGLCDDCLRRLYPDEAEEVIAARDS